MRPMSILKSSRMRQIRLFAKVLSVLGNTSLGAAALARARENPLLRPLLEALLGYRRTFATFSDAERCAASYIPIGHEHPDEIEAHTQLADIVRESDYPVLFFLTPTGPKIRTVFDLGGNVGNLFYVYSRYINFPGDLKWLVYDLPMKKSAGEQLAAERGENRIHFVDALAAASGADLFIASGSLHYFDSSLDQMIKGLEKPPRQVIVNRSPVSRGADLISVQDNGPYLVPCKIHSRQKLVDGMQALGYRLSASWPIYERSLWVPLYPDLSSHHYSGFLFEM